MPSTKTPTPKMSHRIYFRHHKISQFHNTIPCPSAGHTSKKGHVNKAPTTKCMVFWIIYESVKKTSTVCQWFSILVSVLFCVPNSAHLPQKKKQHLRNSIHSHRQQNTPRTNHHQTHSHPTKTQTDRLVISVESIRRPYCQRCQRSSHLWPAARRCDRAAGGAALAIAQLSDAGGRAGLAARTAGHHASLSSASWQQQPLLPALISRYESVSSFQPPHPHSAQHKTHSQSHHRRQQHKQHKCFASRLCCLMEIASHFQYFCTPSLFHSVSRCVSLSHCHYLFCILCLDAPTTCSCRSSIVALICAPRCSANFHTLNLHLLG